MMEEIFGLPTNHHVSNMNTNDFMDLAIARNNISQSLSNNSTNYSEEVRVPSSEHVAEIVGRQGMGKYLLHIYTFNYKTKMYATHLFYDLILTSLIRT